jgi:hypothetical protein
MNTTISPDNYEIFFDRELSWIDFNLRVLDEAIKKEDPEGKLSISHPFRIVVIPKTKSMIRV